MSAPTVFVSPVGRLAWPNLNTPRQFQGVGKFSYDTGLDVEGAAATEFELFLTNYAADYAKRVGKRGSISLDAVIRPAVTKDRQTGQVTTLDGILRFQFKVGNLDNWDRKPAFYHADGTPYAAEPQIGAGTLAEIAFTVYEWKAGPTHGLSLTPEGIRIHELVERKVISVNHDYQTLFENRAGSPVEAKGKPFPSAGTKVANYLSSEAPTRPV